MNAWKTFWVVVAANLAAGIVLGAAGYALTRTGGDS